MAIRLSDVYIDARQAVEEALQNTPRVSIKKYGAFFSNPCDVTHFFIEDVEDEEGYGNLDMTITYKEQVINPADRYSTVEKTQKLKVLSNRADICWTFNMINKIWNADYPSTVAVNVETGVVYLFNVRISGIELVEFGVLEPNEVEAFLEDWNERDPFRIFIDEEAMFKYIDGSEGYNYLREHIFVELNCLTKIRVYPRLTNVI